MEFDVFISYSSKDKAIADAVCSRLEAGGIRCWIAPRDVIPGRSYGEAIIEAIRQARVMVLVFSANANASNHIAKEVERAVSNGLAILPFRIEDVMPGKSLDYFIGSVHWLDAMTPPLEKHLEELVITVHKLVPGERQAPPAPHTVSLQQTSAPRPGLPAQPTAPAASSSTKIWIALATIAALVLIGIGTLWVRGGRSGTVPEGQVASAQPSGEASSPGGTAATNRSQPAKDATAGIIGCYHWFNNQPVVIHGDGTITGGPFTGRWQLISSASRTYTFTWPKATDTVSVAPNQQSLNGGNQYGFQTSATRMTAGTGLVGTWRWPNGVPVVVFPDGTFSAGTFRGTWKVADGARGVYTLTWPNPVDRVALSSDGSRISGSNQYGFAISGVRTLPCSEK
jgi:hypothetical protein